MIRTAIIGTVALAALGTFVFGRDLFSYAKVAGNNARSALKSQVSLETEIDRARSEVESLVPEIRNVMHVIAEQEVNIRHKSAEIDRKEMALGDQRAAILALRQDLGSGKSKFQYASRTYTADDLQKDLAKRFERYKSAESMLTSDRQILRAWEQTLDANREKLDNLLAAKQELEVQIEQLDARLKTVQAAEEATAIDVDDSRLSRAKKLIADLNKQIDVRETRLDMEGKSLGLIPVDAKERAPENIASEIDEYFGNETPASDLSEIR